MKRLYRSRTNRVLSGVCGGLGEYFKIDPVIVRLVFLVLVLFGGSGLLLYLVALVIIPNEPEVEEDAKPTDEFPAPNKGRFWWGLILILVGVVLWGINQPFFYWSWAILPGVHAFSRVLVPLVMVIGGIYLLYTFGRRLSSGEAQTRDELRFYRSRENRKIGGVCGGLAEHFKVDPALVRIIFVIGAFFYLAGLLLYLVLMVVLPEEPYEPEAVEEEEVVVEKTKKEAAKPKSTKSRTPQKKK